MAHTERKCGYCAYLNKDLLRVCKGKFECERDHSLHFADQDAPGRCFTEIFWKDIDLAKECIDESRRYKGMGCHIVTAIVEILINDAMANASENKLEELKTLNENLRAFQVFRGAVMGGDPAYRDSIMEYDVVAPLIAFKLRALPNSVDVARSLYVSYLLPCVAAIKEGNVDRVVGIYGDMMNGLMNICPVSYVVGDVAYENYNPLAGLDVSPFEGEKEHSI